MNQQQITNLRQYIGMGLENLTLRMIDLKRLDFSAKEVKRIPMYGTQQVIVDLTNGL